jgi:chemotaxis protein histidine kinase CheA
VHEAAQPGNEKPSTAASEGSTQAETVRLTTTKLDTLLALMGELQVARIGVGHHLSELQEIHEQLTAWETEWRRIRPQYRRLLLDVDTARTSATSEAAARL